MTDTIKEQWLCKRIPLTRGAHAIVDAEDFEWLNETSWCLSKRGYAERRVTTGPYQSHMQKMHRLIMGVAGDKSGIQVDHINADTLDNRRSNLRLCTAIENNRNRQKGKPSNTGYRGAYRVTRNGTWTGYVATIQGDYLGYFKTPEDAARAWDKEARARYGEFAVLNFPEEQSS